MRRINPSRFRVATRGTSREINSRIVLNLVRAHQPISRADLARTMGVGRGAVTLIVNDLLARKLIFEGATGETVRGRKPTFLYIDSRRRAVVAADIRASETFLMLADLLGKPLTGVDLVSRPCAIRSSSSRRSPRASSACSPTIREVDALRRHRRRRARHGRALDDARAACADARLAQRRPARAAGGGDRARRCRSRTPAAPAPWRRCGRMRERPRARTAGDLVFVSVSDGIGVGVIINGEVLRGRHNIAGEFGHVPLSLDGPRCSCGSNGCWEAYVSNRATLARYFGRPVDQAGPRTADAAARSRSRT